MKMLITIILAALATGNALTQSTDIKSLYQKGTEEFSHNNFDKALHYFQQIHQAAPKELAAIEYITVCYNRMGKYVESAEFSKLLCKLSPYNADYFSNTCFQLTLANRPEAALEYGKRAVALDKRTYNHKLNLAHAYLLLKNKPKAIYWYLKALEWTPSKQDFDRAFGGDFSLLDQLNLISESNAQLYQKELEFAWNEAAADGSNLRLLASILSYKDSAFSDKRSEMLDSLKAQFIQSESKASVVRYDVVASFLTDLGLREFEKRNWAKAIGGYFPLADSMYSRAEDSLGRANLALTLSKDLLRLLRIENRMTMVKEPLGYALDAYDLVKKYGLLELEAEVLNQIGICSQQFKLQPQSAKAFEQLLSLSNEQKDATGIMNAAHGLSKYYEIGKNFDKAAYYNQLAIAQLKDVMADPETVFSIRQTQLELLHKKDQAKSALQGALQLKAELDKGMNNERFQSALCEWVGSVLIEYGKNDFAQIYFDSAINYYFDYQEKNPAGWNRKAPAPIGKEREKSFRLLTYLSAADGNTKAAFFYAECLKDQLLRTYLDKQVPSTPFVIKLEEAQLALEDDAAGISFTGTKTNKGSILAFDRSKSMSFLMDDEQALRVLQDTGLSKTLKRLASIFTAIGRTDADSIVAVRSLTLMQYDYLRNGNAGGSRSQIARKASVQESDWTEERASIAKVLYDLYVKPIEPIIKGKKKLIISPDFILQVFPFETIMLPDGRFMAEVYDITYTPGFTIKQELGQRLYQPTTNVLAIGNPDYSNYHPENSSGRAFDLSLLGIKAWADLPGTDKELQGIKQKLGGSKVVSGATVSESWLKQLSKSGELAKAGILHFALHGIAGPASVKEDNSLVVTEPAESDEDGLLQFFEATSLNVKAALVCLSACETGISQLEDDGSMVTMGTAFLAAGAKAVLATNWTIDDEATAIFVNDFYDQVIRLKTTFATALANTKRKFISGTFGDRYKDPFFWAPFKYIGY